MKPLDAYAVSPERGFLTPYEMDEIFLPDMFDPVVTLALDLPKLLPTGRVRHFLDQIPQINEAAFDQLDDARLRKLMVHYSFIVQSYVWGEDKVPDFLPRNLAVPYCHLSDLMGQYPLLPYTGYTLDNWARLDKQGPISLDNICVIQNFLGGQDENWFILVHVEIEAKAGPALAAIPPLLGAVDAGDTKAVLRHLRDIRDAWDQINPVFDRMVERCDPHTYYLRVRPYIHGWKDNPALPEGLIYKGVENFDGKGQLFRGQTGSQSSIVPTMDALLGVTHQKDEFRAYLDDLHQYRPPGHRAFIEDVRDQSRLREYVQSLDQNVSGHKEIRDLYNEILDYVMKFRTRHLEYAASYINKQARSAAGNPTEIGTGGTPFMAYLKKHRDETQRMKLAHQLA